MKRRAFSQQYKPGAVDGAAAIRRAEAILLNARTLHNLTAESLARTCGLSIRRAEYLLTIARQRRSADVL